MASTPPICDFGWKARDFRLSATDGKIYSLSDLRGPKGMLVVFICNHCPYVKAITGALVRDAKDLREVDRPAIGDGEVVVRVRAASVDRGTWHVMAGLPYPIRAAGFGLRRPKYLNPGRSLAGTREVFGFNAKDELQYRGRLDASRTSAVAGARRDLYEAMIEVARSGKGPAEQISSMGCSIKWKAAQW